MSPREIQLIETVRDATRDITPADRHAILDMIEAANARIAELSTCKLCNSTGHSTPCAYPTEINRQQAKRIAELEAQVTAAEKQEPVAWYVPDDRGNVYMTTGYSHEASQWKQIYKEVIPLYAALLTEVAPNEALNELFEVLMRRNIKCGSEAYLTLRCVGVPPSKKEFARAIELAAKEKA
jgi:hypothetical protein